MAGSVAGYANRMSETGQILVGDRRSRVSSSTGFCMSAVRATSGEDGTGTEAEYMRTRSETRGILGFRRALYWSHAASATFSVAGATPIVQASHDISAERPKCDTTEALQFVQTGHV